MMHSGEMCDALLNGGIGETVKLSGDVNNLTTAMRFFKGGKMSIRGLVELDQSNYKGTNIRKANLADAKSVFDVFDVFTTETTEKCRRPIIDAEHNGLAASDGWKMLVCRIPQQFPIADAVPSGFTNDIAFRWREIAEDMECSDYVLSFYRRMATFGKGSEKHGLLQAIRDAVMAYSHTADDGCWNTLRLKIGTKFYDAVSVANLVDALFKLGCSTVAFCEKTAFDGIHVCTSTPLHIFGFGCEMDAAKGVIMPLRYADDSLGAFVMPTGGATERKVA